MHIAVCVKQVLDPDGVNSYALWGKLEVDASGRAFDTRGAVPLIINAYDEQAMEAALRIRESGVECTISALSAGGATVPDVLKRCVAMGADRAHHVLDPEAGAADGFRTAALLAALIERIGPVDLVICGRQGSDYDQGTVPAVLAEFLDASFVTMAASVEVDGGVVRVRRVTPDGFEEVEADLPAVLAVSNELGLARFPSSRGLLAARKTPPAVYQADELGPPAAHRVELTGLAVPRVQGHCELIDGSSPGDKASHLLAKLTAVGLFDG
jgi:electron transfer flavoprotein beta subunit